MDAKIKREGQKTESGPCPWKKSPGSRQINRSSGSSASQYNVPMSEKVGRQLLSVAAALLVRNIMQLPAFVRGFSSHLYTIP